MDVQAEWDGQPFADLRTTGLLWLINASVFHPRGYALALHSDESGDCVGWSLLGDGSEPWTFPDDCDAEFTAASRLFAGPEPGTAATSKPAGSSPS